MDNPGSISGLRHDLNELDAALSRLEQVSGKKIAAPRGLIEKQTQKVLCYVPKPEKQIEDECVSLLKKNTTTKLSVDQQVRVQFGSTHNHRADIVVSEGNQPLLVIECKAKPKFSDNDFRQAKSYALILGSQYFVLHNGVNWEVYHTNDKSHEAVFSVTYGVVRKTNNIAPTILNILNFVVEMSSANVVEI